VHERIKRGLCETNGRKRDQVLEGRREGLILGRRKELNDLITAFGRRVHEEHPNLERIGCPGRQILTTLAETPAPPVSESLLEHIRTGAACLDELKQLRLNKRSR
jgi:hypothetical protein